MNQIIIIFHFQHLEETNLSLIASRIHTHIIYHFSGFHSSFQSWWSNWLISEGEWKKTFKFDIWFVSQGKSAAQCLSNGWMDGKMKNSPNRSESIDWAADQAKKKKRKFRINHGPKIAIKPIYYIHHHHGTITCSTKITWTLFLARKKKFISFPTIISLFTISVYKN